MCVRMRNTRTVTSTRTPKTPAAFSGAGFKDCFLGYPDFMKLVKEFPRGYVVSENSAAYHMECGIIKTRAHG